MVEEVRYYKAWRITPADGGPDIKWGWAEPLRLMGIQENTARFTTCPNKKYGTRQFIFRRDCAGAVQWKERPTK